MLFFDGKTDKGYFRDIDISRMFLAYSGVLLVQFGLLYHLRNEHLLIENAALMKME